MAANGCTVKDVPAAEFITTYAAYLKRVGLVELPPWVDTVKTAPSKELAPYDQDWLYIRIASIARKIYIRGGIGTGEFRKIYGTRQRRGMKPSRSSKAAGGLIRNALQQLERLGVIEKDPRGGRRLTTKGQAEMDTQAAQCLSLNA
ncbi:40S ribosomal protein S19-1 [Gracilariopsis chorda]|uniref:40S ribosomal protein S19-1 n=1 Tax=Gracilariopsis chorda TaxID=448386 RepID=A0A2V3J6N0_9FLOR|nr:40S ribosomal protein S19-1 [Gracilariopsis chorda]|eukprot:PXF50081.1 40S ribosomal protein S19-1 [Gracilariopsis chorda]